MNKIFKTTTILFALLLESAMTQGQITPLQPGDAVIAPYRLLITFYKTTNLVFPYAIKSVDRGSQDILAQKALNVANVLQLKAGRPGFEETNLTVITTDGKLYSYILDYADTPSVLNVSFNDRSRWNSRVFFSEQDINEQEIEELARKAAASSPTARRLNDRSGGITFHLYGVYVSGPIMYISFGIKNHSAVDYDISQLRMVIRDRKKARRTAMQEVEINPVFALNATDKVAGGTEREIVYAVPKFTIPDKKYLRVQLMEVNGGRTMELSVYNKTVVKAMPIE